MRLRSISRRKSPENSTPNRNHRPYVVFVRYARLITISPVHTVAKITRRYSPSPLAMIVAFVDCACHRATGQMISNATEKN